MAGVIKLCRGGHAIREGKTVISSQAVASSFYTDPVDRRAIIERWRRIYGDRMETMFFQIQPNVKKNP